MCFCVKDGAGGGKKREIVGIIRGVFGDCSATKPFPQEKLAPGEPLVNICVCVFKDREQKSFDARELSEGCSPGQSPSSPYPPFRLDYIPKGKSEHPQRATDGGRYGDLKTE